MGGQQDEFAQHIIAEHGVDVLDELLRLKHTAVKRTRADLQGLIDFYKTKLETLIDFQEGQQVRA